MFLLPIGIGREIIIFFNQSENKFQENRSILDCILEMKCAEFGNKIILREGYFFIIGTTDLGQTNSSFTSRLSIKPTNQL